MHYISIYVLYSLLCIAFMFMCCISYYSTFLFLIFANTYVHCIESVALLYCNCVFRIAIIYVLESAWNHLCLMRQSASGTPNSWFRTLIRFLRILNGFRILFVVEHVIWNKYEKLEMFVVFFFLSVFILNTLRGFFAEARLTVYCRLQVCETFSRKRLGGQGSIFKLLRGVRGDGTPFD